MTHDRHTAQRDIFAMVFLLAQRWQYLGDRELRSAGITTKQWFLLVALHALFSAPPSLGELAQAMGSSRQNVKQIALNLERRGFVQIFTDEYDQRILRIKLTPRNQQFWDARKDQDELFIKRLFAAVDDQQLSGVRNTVKALLDITDNLMK